jgi:hypothetical protein
MTQLRLPFDEIAHDAQASAAAARREVRNVLLGFAAWTAFLVVMFRIQIPVDCEYCHKPIGTGTCVAGWLVMKACRSHPSHVHCAFERLDIPRDPRPH